MVTRLILASTSPARLKVLRDGGIEPIAIAPEVDEDAVEARAIAAGLISSTADVVRILAKAKAEAVASRPEARGALVLGCDSQLDFEGESLGKPHQPEVALERWRKLRGNSGRLFSGHWLIDNRNLSGSDNPLPPATGVVSSTLVHFADLSDQEIEDYVATGEPLKVAGAFTIDGLGGAFLRGIEGDAHTVIGLSLASLREMSNQLGVPYTSLWNRVS
jgi:septum formation protein